MRTHENDSRRDALTQKSSDRVFGLTFFVVFGIIGLWPMLDGRPPSLVFLGISCVFLALAIAVPALLSPLNQAWMKFGAMLHALTSPIILGIMFYLVITPIGLLMRLLGKDLLRLRFDPLASTYWIRRGPPGSEITSLDRQY